MAYTNELCEQLSSDSIKVSSDLQSLMFKNFDEIAAAIDDDTRKHLAHGVGRRLSVIKTSLEGVFDLFPPNRERPLGRNVLTQVQINLHAFVINVAGIFDNWAWAFVHRHDLAEQIGNRNNVGLFKRATQDYLPESLSNYLSGDTIRAWHTEYAKEYRDALAHRIPLYIPPASWTDVDRLRYEELEAEKVACIRGQEWERLDEVWDEQDGIGTSCAIFLHEISDERGARPVHLHPQVLCDAMTVVDFGNRFYEAWHETAT